MCASPTPRQMEHVNYTPSRWRVPLHPHSGSLESFQITKLIDYHYDIAEGVPLQLRKVVLWGGASRNPYIVSSHTDETKIFSGSL